MENWGHDLKDSNVSQMAQDIVRMSLSQLLKQILLLQIRISFIFFYMSSSNFTKPAVIRKPTKTLSSTGSELGCLVAKDDQIGPGSKPVGSNKYTLTDWLEIKLFTLW